MGKRQDSVGQKAGNMFLFLLFLTFMSSVRTIEKGQQERGGGEWSAERNCHCFKYSGFLIQGLELRCSHNLKNPHFYADQLPSPRNLALVGTIPPFLSPPGKNGEGIVTRKTNLVRGAGKSSGEFELHGSQSSCPPQPNLNMNPLSCKTGDWV